MKGKFLWFFSVTVVASLARTILVEDDENLGILEEDTFSVQPHIFENKILEAIIKLKEILKSGDPRNDIPPLDPYFLSYQDFEFFIMDTELKGFFQNTTFANFSRFEPENIKFQLLPLHFKLDLFLDYLKIDGRYKMLGKILNEIPVNGTGKFISETKNLSLSLYLRPMKLNSSLQIKDLIFEFKTLSEMINYTNELIDDKVHVLDEDLALYILDQVQTKYIPPLMNMIKVVLNHFLLGYSFAEVIRIIFEFLKKN